ncbi:MAG: FecR domain-containing protein [Myxococcales bacterium]
MTPPEPQLDESVRRKFQALGEAVEAPFDAAMAQRIVQRLQAEARRRERRKRRLWSTALAGCVAAAAAVMLLWSQRTREPSAESRVAVCAWVDQSLVFVTNARGERELLLGAAGRVVAGADAEVRATRDAACALGIELTRGAVAAELHDLRPGSLSVRTSFGDVRVRGTTFSVEVGTDLRVVLVSGAVDLVDEGEVALRMAPGKALQRRARRADARLTAASREDVQRVEDLLHAPARGPVTAPAPAEPSASALPALPEIATREGVRGGSAPRRPDLLGEAEAARRKGENERARALYVQAQQAGQANAEVALLRHAGFELELANPRAAEELLTEHHRRYPESHLAAEAAWLGVRMRSATGDVAAARAAAGALLRDFPDAPQARAARRMLAEP